MSNIFTRRGYDLSQFRSHELENSKSSSYNMDVNLYENQNACVHSNVSNQAEVARPLNSEGFLNLEKKIDIESKLRNQHLELNSQNRTNNDYQQELSINPKVCNVSKTSIYEDSRFKEPISNYREMSPQQKGLHFSPFLHMNPQNVHSNNDTKHSPDGRLGVSTRIEAKKDMYVTDSQIKENIKLQNIKERDNQNFIKKTSELLQPRKIY